MKERGELKMRTMLWDKPTGIIELPLFEMRKTIDEVGIGGGSGVEWES